jgi:hypothetical protein
MELSNPALTLAALSAAAGAVHMVAPDHWMPASLVAWQRGWGLRRTAGFQAGLLLAHVLAGGLIYLVLAPGMTLLDPTQVFHVVLGLVFGVMALRLFRFTRVADVFRAGPGSHWGLIGVVALLGPCESIVPILLKSRQLGAGYGLALGAFLIGTLVSGVLLGAASRWLWDQPLWLPRAMSWIRSRQALVPAAAGIVLGIGAILRI